MTFRGERLLRGLICGAIIASLATPAAASDTAATIEALPLPVGFTIAPEGDRKLMTFGADGTVYAVANQIDGLRVARAVRWLADGRREMFAPIPQPGDDQLDSAPVVDAVAPAASGAYVTVSRTSDGAFIHTSFSTDRWTTHGARTWKLPACASVVETRVFAAAADAIALTNDPSWASPGVDLSNPESVESELPTATAILGDRCMDLGPATLTGIRGESVVGYIGYLDGKPAPTNINLMDQAMHAARWNAGRKIDLGTGVPFATTASGTSVGASALPGHEDESATGNFFGPAGTYSFATPHAVLWAADATRVPLVHGDRRSVAWDINAAQTVVGTLRGSDGRHRAFRRGRAGRIELLDDLPHPPGWRFESAYALDERGDIAGIGTANGRATAFIWKPATTDVARASAILRAAQTRAARARRTEAELGTRQTAANQSGTPTFGASTRV